MLLKNSNKFLTFVIFHKCTKLWSTNLCTLLCAGVHSGFTSEQVVAYVWNGDIISNVELQQLLGLNSIAVRLMFINFSVSLRQRAL